VPTRAGFWVPWFPYSLPQRWPFCWWVAVAVDQISRSLVGFTVFNQAPTSAQVQAFLERAIRFQGFAPAYVVTDKGRQFWCRSFKRWCKSREIRPRYGRVGEPASISIVERFIRSMKQECTRCLLVPLSLAAMRRELSLYAAWYNTERPHMTLAGKTPQEAYERRGRRQCKIEPRRRWPHQPRRRNAERVQLAVGYVEGRKHLPVIELRRAA
jgi:putative transposase